MNPTISHISQSPPSTPPKMSRGVVFATVLAALLTTGSSFAYMWTQERPPSANDGTGQSFSSKPDAGHTRSAAP